MQKAPTRKVGLFDRLQDWVWSRLYPYVLEAPWLLTHPSPLADAPKWYRRRLGADYLGEELASALGCNPPQWADRHAALGLAKLGASPWYDRGHGMHRTNMQIAVSEGWCEVVEELITQEAQRINGSPFFSWLWERHLASLWMEVYSDEMEDLLGRLAPLEKALLHVRPKPALFRLSERMVQRGRVRSLSVVYPHLPHYAKKLVVQGMDIEGAALNGVLFALSHLGREEIETLDGTGNSLIHTLALDPQGLSFLLARDVDIANSLDKAGNNAWLKWCLHARSRQWNTFGLQNDTQEYREASFHSLLQAGLDPEHRNAAGMSMTEQAECELGSQRWTLLRSSGVEQAKERIAMLNAEVISRQLRRAAPAQVDAPLGCRRL
jgi:hypothetical protein